MEWLPLLAVIPAAAVLVFAILYERRKERRRKEAAAARKAASGSTGGFSYRSSSTSYESRLDYSWDVVGDWGGSSSSDSYSRSSSCD